MSVESLDAWRKKLAERSTSPSLSTQNTQSEKTGLVLTEHEMQVIADLLAVLKVTRVKPYTTKSDFARRAATEIGILASEGMISTKVDSLNYTNLWMITPEGIEQMEDWDDILGSGH